MDVLTRPANPAKEVTLVRAPKEAAVVRLPRMPARLVIVAASLAVLWMAYELLSRDDRLGTPAYDQAFFQQLVWNIDHGHWFVTSLTASSFLGLHFSPLLVVPAALELVWADPRMLTLIDSVALALAGPAAFLFLRAAFSPSRLGAYLAAGLAVALPFTPPLQEAARADFHSEVMALPTALIAGWAGLTRRPLLMWLAAAVALTAKEDQVYTVAVIGLLIAIRGRGRMRRHGSLVAALSILWGIAVFSVIMPALRGGALPDTANYYSWLGSGPAALLAPIRDPVGVWDQISNPTGWAAIVALLAGCCFLPLLRPRWALLVLPPLIADLLSRHLPQPSLQLQYGLLLVVPVLVATGMGGRTALALVERVARRRRWPRVAMRPVRLMAGPALVVAAVPGLLLGALLGPLPPSGHAQGVFLREPGLSRLVSIAAIIPPGAPVAADDDVAAPLAARPKLLVLPRLDPDCYVVVDRAASPQTFMSPTERTALLANLPASRRLLADDSRFQVWSPVGG